MAHDLCWLRLGELIRQLPHTNRCMLTVDGIRIAVFYTKIYNRLLVPLTAANQPQALLDSASRSRLSGSSSCRGRREPQAAIARVAVANRTCRQQGDETREAQPDVPPTASAGR